jgi:hypothetical protein
MSELIQDRRTSEKTAERYDLFSSLLDANDNGGSLSTQELFGTPCDIRGIRLPEQLHDVGNIFIFQLAGHEVRAPTLGLF